MEKTYDIALLAQMTGLTDRTLRSDLKKGILNGTLLNGKWQFSPQQVQRFFDTPAVCARIKAKQDALIADFLKNAYIQSGAEQLTVLDWPQISPQKVQDILDYTLPLVNDPQYERPRFSFRYQNGRARMVLIGSQPALRRLCGVLAFE